MGAARKLEMLKYFVFEEDNKKAIIYYITAGFIIDLYESDELVDTVDAIGSSRQYAENFAKSWVTKS